MIPILVIEELDDLRRYGRPQARQLARDVVRVLWDKKLPDGGFQTAHVGTTAEVFVDEPSHVRLPENDAEIVARAQYVGDLTGHQVAFLAADLGILMRASAAGLTPARTPQ
ncbi:MAG: hypothetical protein E6J45_13885 [Chloroflexi bacterium]|nr:MAG: hypothetical protein E6J45_13885 [Chloroflexota bacterium]